jgi:hypothetical protein
MAAPGTAYQIYSKLDKVLSVLQKSYAFAKFLAAYSTVADVKTKFKVDGVLKESSTAFIGYLNIATENDVFHNPAQLGVVWHGKRLLADAGLNRKGEGRILKVLNTSTTDYDASPENYPARINNLRIFWWFYSPIYNAVSSGTVQISSDGINWTTIYTKSAMSEDDQAFGYIDNPAFIEVSGTFYVKTTTVNDVGTYTSTVFQFNVKMVIDTFTFSASNASDAISGQSRTIYRNSLNFISYVNEGNDATSFFSDENSTPTQASTGFYVKNNTWYQYIYNANAGRNVLYDFGPCSPGSFPQGDPGNIVHTPEEVNYSGYDRDSLEQAEWEVNSGNYDYNTLYLDTVVDYDNNTTIIYAYSDSSHSTFARDGFYVAGEMVEGITSEIQVFNGIATIL